MKQIIEKFKLFRFSFFFQKLDIFETYLNLKLKRQKTNKKKIIFFSKVNFCKKYTYQLFQCHCNEG